MARLDLDASYYEKMLSDRCKSNKISKKPADLLLNLRVVNALNCVTQRILHRYIATLLNTKPKTGLFNPTFTSQPSPQPHTAVVVFESLEVVISKKLLFRRKVQ
jgi:hypothetical protein